MAAHNAHDWAEGNPLPVLFDGCPRCAEHALHPTYSLDGGHLRGLWHEMMAVEFGHEQYRSVLDAQAGGKLYDMAVFLERHSVGVDFTALPIRGES